MSALVWLRRDLRIHDHAALSQALQRHSKVHLVFVFDRAILDLLHERRDRRVEFIWRSVCTLQAELRRSGSDLHILHDQATAAVVRLAQSLQVQAVYTNHDYEPLARERDAQVARSLTACAIEFNSFKDTVVFEKDEILTLQGKPYSVFTPYKNAWLKKLTTAHLQEHACEPFYGRLARYSKPLPTPSLESLGFEATNLMELGVEAGTRGAHTLLKDFLSRIEHYQQARDYPAVRGVSYLSVHNRFGTCSIRELAAAAQAALLENPTNSGASTWLSELVWRDFYFQILWHNPHVSDSCYRPEYQGVRWENSRAWFDAWCCANTGYPIIDAAMRQLNQTGYMHNRLRMIVASFLTKDLLIDWRWGEAYFAQQLIDFDLAANNGGWQWAASTGCDAQPYFRIFNPITQSERFDPKGKFIRRYLPELSDVPDKFIHAPWLSPTGQPSHYPAPIVEHAVQRDRALDMFKQALSVYSAQRQIPNSERRSQQGD